MNIDLFVKESLFYISILNEDKIDSIKKQYPKVTDEEIQKLKQIDPTNGKYLVWLVKLFNEGISINKFNNSEFINKLKLYSNEKFNKMLTPKNRNIMNLSFSKFNVLTNIDDINILLSDNQLIEKAYIGETEHWLVYIPTNYLASKALGKNTNWCTSADSQTGIANFHKYNVQSPLYIFINKNDPKDKYQLHINELQFMDKNDSNIKTKGLLNNLFTEFINSKNISEKIKDAFLNDLYKQLEKINKDIDKNPNSFLIFIRKLDQLDLSLLNDKIKTLYKNIIEKFFNKIKENDLFKENNYKSSIMRKILNSCSDIKFKTQIEKEIQNYDTETDNDIEENQKVLNELVNNYIEKYKNINENILNNEYFIEIFNFIEELSFTKRRYSKKEEKFLNKYNLLNTK